MHRYSTGLSPWPQAYALSEDYSRCVGCATAIEYRSLQGYVQSLLLDVDQNGG